MADIGTAYVRIAPNMTGIQGKIASGMKGAGANATKQLGEEVNSNAGPFQKAIGNLGGIAKTGGKVIAAGIGAGALGLAALTGKALMSGAELEQQLGGAEAVFGKYADSIKEAATSAYFEAGLSQNEFLQGANKMGSLFQGAGFEVEESMEMSMDAMQRASDIASIMGIDTTAALEAVTGMAKGNFTMMDNLGVAMNDTALGAYALSKGIEKTTSEMSIQEKVGLANQLFLEKTAKYAGNYYKENQTLAGSINSTKKAFDNLMAGEGEIDGFMELLVNSIELAVPQIVKILPAIVTGIGEVLRGLVPALSKALPELVPALINAVTGLLTALVDALPGIVKVLVAGLPAIINAFIEIFLGIVKALPEIIKILSEAMPMIIDALVNGLTKPEALTAIIMGAVELFLAIIKAIPLIITALVNALPIILKNIVATLTSRQFISAMISAGFQLMKALISGIVGMTSAIARSAWDILKTIMNVLSPSNMLNIGRQVVQGLWAGIQDMGGWLKDRIMSFVMDKIPGAVRQALGIQSPSKVAAMLGREVPAGLAQGIQKGSSMVEQAATNMANSALTGIAGPVVSPSVAFGGVGASGGTGMSRTTNNTTTIEKVVLGDSGAVQEFFRQLNRDTTITGMGLTPIQGAQ